MTKYCFLDLETTGFDNEKDSIIEISFLIRDENKKIVDSFDKVIIPQNSALTPHITHITGITQEEINKKGVQFSSIKEIVQEKIGDCVIIGHNIDFDIGFLMSKGLEIEKNPRIDTHELVRILLINEESFALEVLAQKYGFAHESAHRAMSDVEANLELFDFLLDKIKNLPKKFFETTKTFFETKTDWYAKILFEDIKGMDDYKFSKPSLEKFSNTLNVNNVTEKLEKLTGTNSIYLKQGDAVKSADYLISLANDLIKKGKKVVVISPKIRFFPSLNKFPTPQVLLDPERLILFAENRKKLTNSETTFYLKCIFRNLLGLRGLDFFDLFFMERNLWKEISLQTMDHPIFKEIIETRKKEDCLLLSPDAFLEFKDLPLFKDRILLIDESEIFAEKLLFHPSKLCSLRPYLESKNEETSIAAHFFVTNFCKEVLEKKLEHSISTFPQKLALKSSDRYKNFADSLKELSHNKEVTQMAEKLENPDPKEIRWFSYFPENGNLVFGVWHPDDWMELKNSLKNFKKIFFYRHQRSGSNIFFKVFIGQSEGEFPKEEDLFSSKTIIIPARLESVKSPAFNSFCAEKIIKLAEESIDEKNFLAVNFSSQETLRKVFEEVSEKFLNSKIESFGEKVSGGDGKVMQKLKEAKNILLLEQKLLVPELENFSFTKLIIQKYPFSPPHPLLGEIQAMMKISGLNFWDIWTIPQVTSNLARRTSVFPHAKEIIWLDPRENSGWGKEILEGAFPYAKKN